MMLNLIADAAAGISPEAVGTILGVALGSSGTWWVVKGRKAPQKSDNPQRFLMDDKYATREEVAELKALHAKTTDDMHKRLNSITIKLNEMSGTLKLMIDILKTRKSL
mgnify:CR=1 FL=1